MLLHILLVSFLFLSCYQVLIAQESLSLEKARQLALQHNQQIIAGNESVEAAKSMQRDSFTKFLPSIQFMGDYTRMNKQMEYDVNLGLDKVLAGMAQANPAVMTDPFYQTLAALAQQGLLPNDLDLKLGEKNNYVLGFNATQPLFTGGKIIDQYQISKANRRLSEAGLVQIKSEILMKTDVAYWTTVSVAEKVKLARQYRDMLTSHLTDLENMLDQGVITQNDYLKAKVKRTDADIQVMQAENGYKLSRMALNQLIGFALDDSIPLSDSLREDSSIQAVQPNSGEIATKRPEIMQIKEGIGISKSMLRLAKSTYFPNILLQGNYTYLNPNPYNSFEKEFGHDWQVSIVAQWMLFDWNGRGFEVSAARHRKNALEAKLSEATEMVNLEARQAQMKYDVAKKKTDLTRISLEQAEENLRNANEQFHEGVMTSSDVLDAQTLWQQSYSNWIESLADVHIQETALRKALGILVDKENS